MEKWSLINRMIYFQSENAPFWLLETNVFILYESHNSLMWQKIEIESWSIVQISLCQVRSLLILSVWSTETEILSQRNQASKANRRIMQALIVHSHQVTISPKSLGSVWFLKKLNRRHLSVSCYLCQLKICLELQWLREVKDKDFFSSLTLTVGVMGSPTLHCILGFLCQAQLQYQARRLTRIRRACLATKLDNFWNILLVFVFRNWYPCSDMGTIL